MKKLIFLFIMAVLFIGFMPALNTARPPGAQALDIAMPEYSTHEAAVILGTVPAMAPLSSELPAGISVFPDIIDFTGLPQGYLIKPIISKVQKEPGYWLRL